MSKTTDPYQHSVDITKIIGVENDHAIVKLSKSIEIDAHECWVEVDYIAVNNPYLETLLVQGKVGFKTEASWQSVRVKQNLGAEFKSELVGCVVASCELRK